VYILTVVTGLLVCKLAMFCVRHMSVSAWYTPLECHVKPALSATLHNNQNKHLTTSLGPLHC